MKKRVGIWIDQRKSIIVSIVEKETVVKTIMSEVEKNITPSGGARSSTPYGPQDVASEQQWLNRRMQQLAGYYKEVIRNAEDAQDIFIFGPGEAKIQLEKEINRRKALLSKVKKIEPADKMTEAQIVAKVKKFYKIAK